MPRDFRAALVYLRLWRVSSVFPELSVALLGRGQKSVIRTSASIVIEAKLQNLLYQHPPAEPFW